MAGSPITLRQVEAPYPGIPARTLVLGGSCGPINQLDGFGGTQRYEMTEYPGASVSDARLDGPKESDIKLTFRWWGRMMRPGDATFGGSPLARAGDVLNAANQLRRDPALVELTFEERSIIGIVSEVTPRYKKAHEWDVSMTFVPIAPDNYFDLTPFDMPSQDEVSKWQRMVDTFEGAIADIETVVTWRDDVIDSIQNDIGNVRGMLGRALIAANSLANIEQPVRGVYSQLAASVEGTILLAEELRDAAGRLNPANLAQSDDAEQQIRASAMSARAGKAGRLVQHQAALSRRDYNEENDVVAVHEGKVGDHIWNLSWKYYRTYDHGQLIARRNRLRSPAIVPGARIIIPRPHGKT